MAVENRGISCCFDEESERMLDDYRKKGLSDTSVKLADQLMDGVSGSTVLELGCGFGALALELVKQGAASAAGMDLSPKMIKLASSMAKEEGLSEKVSFEVGDGASARLTRSDIVVLDAVLCCYPDMLSLLDNSSSAAGRFYAFAVPDDTRFATRLLSVVLPLQRVFFRRDGFRFFIHPTGAMKARLHDKGFELVSRSQVGLIWSVFVFALR